MLKLMDVDLFYSNTEVKCCTTQKECLANKIRLKVSSEKSPFLFTVNWRMTPLHCAVTFAVFNRPVGGAPEWALLEKILNLSKEELTFSFLSRLKVIPRVVEGPWLVKSAVGQTPVIIGKKLDTLVFYDKNFVEISIDVFSSLAARNMISELDYFLLFSIKAFSKHFFF
jgi:hypothetical protein